MPLFRVNSETTLFFRASSLPDIALLLAHRQAGETTIFNLVKFISLEFFSEPKLT